jgi:dihydrofolate synthase/folylpolyglutamate synthase
MQYKETIEYLYTQLPMFAKIGERAIKKTLDNTIKLCSYLDNPQLKFKSIHIAGTNGKGSTAHTLSSIFQEQGFKTGLYTSPHILDFRERIKINGKMCNKQFISKITQQLQPIIQEIQPSFFEITVAMAFYYFAKQKVDIAIIETGLGGKLDSTNIIQPILSIITNISFDHQNILGNTLAEIAKEKAGIIKPKTPIIVGRKQDEIKNIFKTVAKENHADIYFADDIIKIENYNYSNTHTTIQYLYNNKLHEIKTDLNSVYQYENIKTVLAAINIYNKYSTNNIEEKNIQKGLNKVYKNSNLMARWQCIQQQPKTIVDVAHNEDGIKQALAQLKQEKYEQLHIIYGAVKDKDVSKILKLLPKNAIYYFTQPTIERKLDVDILLNQAKNENLNGKPYKTTKMAWNAAQKNAQKNDLILVIGSFFILDKILLKKKQNIFG